MLALRVSGRALRERGLQRLDVMLVLGLGGRALRELRLQRLDALALGLGAAARGEGAFLFGSGRERAILLLQPRLQLPALPGMLGFDALPLGELLLGDLRPAGPVLLGGGKPFLFGQCQGELFLQVIEELLSLLGIGGERGPMLLFEYLPGASLLFGGARFNAAFVGRGLGYQLRQPPPFRLGQA
jgi:hypothetical protein